MGTLLFNIYIWFAIILLTLFGLAVLPVILLVNCLFLKRTLAAGLRRAIRFYGWVLVCCVPFLAPVKVEYPVGKLPANAIFVANHNSAIDPYLFGAIPLENSFVTSWPFKIPLYGFFMRLAQYVNTVEGWDEVYRKCTRLLSAGSCVTIWPEGHRSRDGRLGRFKNGAFLLAAEKGYPIVPVCILGSKSVLPPGKWLLRPGRVKLVVLESIIAEDSGDIQERVRELRFRARAAIEHTLELNGHFTCTQPEIRDVSLVDEDRAEVSILS